MVEVHIPKRGICGRLEKELPPPACGGSASRGADKAQQEEEDDDDDDLADDLQLLLEIQSHETLAVEHLERSNRELLEALEVEEDSDFREAVTENCEVLGRKRRLLEKVNEKIRYARQLNTAANPCAATPIAGPVLAPIAPAAPAVGAGAAAAQVRFAPEPRPMEAAARASAPPLEGLSL
mmetsp:Transcript_67048/g.143467  ORF Transcript_67048/g.143467 Transcript_67048/m.143467 type:complete len:180 (+) Transcript_67048:106-645(+)